MSRPDGAWLMMAEKSTHTIGSGVTISERRDQEVGLNRIRNCPRNRERYSLSKLILFGERSLRRALNEYVAHHHHERNHQGKDNLLLFPSVELTNRREASLRCRERLGGLLKFYHWKAA